MISCIFAFHQAFLDIANTLTEPSLTFPELPPEDLKHTYSKVLSENCR